MSNLIFIIYIIYYIFYIYLFVQDQQRMLDILLDYVAVLLIVNDLVEDVFDVFETFDSSTSGEISGLK